MSYELLMLITAASTLLGMVAGVFGAAVWLYGWGFWR